MWPCDRNALRPSTSVSCRRCVAAATQRLQDTLVLGRRAFLSQGHIDLAEHCRQGRPQLVGRIPSEPLLTLERLAKAGEQVVEGAAEVFEFVPRRGDGE